MTLFWRRAFEHPDAYGENEHGMVLAVPRPDAFVRFHDPEAFVERDPVRDALARMRFGREPADLFQRNVFRFRVSREMALDYGLVEPTPEEAAERAASLAEYRRKAAADWARFDWATEALDALDGEANPIARRILDLHRPDQTTTWVTCAGCDFDGSESEPPQWPCRTVQQIAEFHGIELPQGSLYRRPETKPGDTA